MKNIVLGDGKVSVAAFKTEDEFAVVAFVETEPGVDHKTIPLEDHEVAIHFKSKRAMNAFITHLIEIKKYMSMEDIFSEITN